MVESVYQVYFARVLALLLLMIVVLVYIKSRNSEYTEEQLDHIESIGIDSFESATGRFVLPDEFGWEETSYSRLRSVLNRLLFWWNYFRSEGLYVKTRSTLDADGNEVYLASVNQYMLASRNRDELIEVIEEQYLEPCFNSKTPQPHEYEYQYEMCSYGLVDFEENRKRLRLDCLTRIHSSIADTPPESVGDWFEDILSPSQDEIHLKELYEGMVDKRRYPFELVDKNVEYLLTQGKMEVDDDGFVNSF